MTAVGRRYSHEPREGRIHLPRSAIGEGTDSGVLPADCGSKTLQPQQQQLTWRQHLLI